MNLLLFSAACAALALGLPNARAAAQPAFPPPPVPAQPAQGQLARPEPEAAGWVPRGAAEIEVLDKVEAISRQLTIPVGQSAQVATLTIAVRACDVRPPDQPPDAAAYLAVTDSRPDEPGFHGWMLEKEPWVSMLQSPVYDLRVAGCR